MEERQISTSVSDLVLALSSFHAAYKTANTSLSAVGGFLIIGIAASFGTVRFGVNNPGDVLVGWHKYFSWLASVLGLPLLASAYYRQNNISLMANAHLASGLSILILGNYLTERAVAMATQAVSTAAVISIGALNVLQFNAHAALGSLLYALSGTVIGTNGSWFGIPRVDMFHYALVLGNIGYMMGLTLESAPVFYKQKVQ